MMSEVHLSDQLTALNHSASGEEEILSELINLYLKTLRRGTADNASIILRNLKNQSL